MSTLDSILKKTRKLSHADRLHLARAIFEEAMAEDSGGDDEIEVGRRGLSAFTASTRAEDWSEFYPPDIRDREVGSVVQRGDIWSAELEGDAGFRPVA